MVIRGLLCLLSGDLQLEDGERHGQELLTGKGGRMRREKRGAGLGEKTLG